MSARRWLSVVVGAVAVVIGAALTLKPFSSLDALTLYIAASLIVAGAGELLTRSTERPPWSERIMGALLVVAGVLALATGPHGESGRRHRRRCPGAGWRRAHGWSLARHRRRTRRVRDRRDRKPDPGVLALAWPDLTVLVVSVLVGPVAIILGAAQIVRTLRDRPRAAARPCPLGRRGGSRLRARCPPRSVAALAPASDVLGFARGLQTSPSGALFATFLVKGYSDTYPDVKPTDYIRGAAQTGVREAVDRCLSETATLA